MARFEAIVSAFVFNNCPSWSAVIAEKTGQSPNARNWCKRVLLTSCGVKSPTKP